MSENKNVDALSIRRILNVSATPAQPLDPGVDIVRIRGQAAPVSITLPLPTAGNTQLRPIDRYRWEFQCGPEAGTNNVTLLATAPALINGAASITLNAAFSRAVVVFDAASGSYFASIQEGPGTRIANTLAFSDANAAVPLAIPAVALAAQATDMDLLAASLTAGYTGLYQFSAAIRFAGTAGDVVVIDVKARSKATAIVLTNNTASGQNCFFAAAAGGIVYDGVATGGTKHYTNGYLLAAAPGLSWSFQWSGVLAAAGGNIGFANGSNVIGSIQMHDLGNPILAVSAAGAIAAGALTQNSLYMEEKQN